MQSRRVNTVPSWLAIFAQPRSLGIAVGVLAVSEAYEARPPEPEPSIGRPHHRDLTMRARDAADGLHELALDGSGALNAQA